jgi:hypothetical protein
MAFSGKVREQVKKLTTSLTKTNINEPSPDTDNADPPPSYPYPEQEESPATDSDVLYDASEEPIDTSVDIDDISGDPISTSPAPRNELDEVIDHAATGLMTAFSDPEGCFIIDEMGCCKINKAHPPTIEQSLVAVSHIMKLKDLGNIVDDKSSWMLGSAVASLETFHGENFNVSQVCDETTKAYNTIITAVGVFKAFPSRYKLSFTAHKEAHYAKIPQEHKNLILSKAETFKLSSKNIRSLCSIAKVMGDDATIRSIRSAKQALDLIAAYRESKVTYIVYDNGTWSRINGVAGDPPEGKIVLNTKTWVASANKGPWIAIERNNPFQK